MYLTRGIPLASIPDKAVPVFALPVVTETPVAPATDLELLTARVVVLEGQVATILNDHRRWRWQG